MNKPESRTAATTVLDGKVQKVFSRGAGTARSGSGRRRPQGRAGEGKGRREKERRDEGGHGARRRPDRRRDVPPDPAKIEAAKEAGRIAAKTKAGGKVQLVISHDQQPWDSLTLDVDAAENRLLGLGVDTYLDKPDESVTLAVQISSLP